MDMSVLDLKNSVYSECECSKNFWYIVNTDNKKFSILWV